MVQRVREGSETGYLPNSSNFMGELGVSRRSVTRDLDFLRDEELALSWKWRNSFTSLTERAQRPPCLLLDLN